MVQTLIGRYGERLRRLFEAGKASGELDPGLDVEAAALLFIGTIQGLVIQAMVAGDVGRIRREASRSEEHTSELQSLMRISYAVCRLKTKKHSKENKNVRTRKI